jgi:hypothetical protein
MNFGKEMPVGHLFQFRWHFYRRGVLSKRFAIMATQQRAKIM